MEKMNHSPARLFKWGESEITVVQHRHSKVLGLTGQHQIPALQAAERGVLITVVTYMSPTGNYTPPLLIFPRKNMKMELMNCTPPESSYACHSFGWIQSHAFADLFRHFICHDKPTAEDSIIFVLNGYFSHVRNLKVINLGWEIHVSITSLPPTQHSQNAAAGPCTHMATEGLLCSRN
jgi:hypothetical protein